IPTCHRGTKRTESEQPHVADSRMLHKIPLGNEGRRGEKARRVPGLSFGPASPDRKPPQDPGATGNPESVKANSLFRFFLCNLNHVLGDFYAEAQKSPGPLYPA